MFRYVVSLILVNTYYCSFGHPLPQNATRLLVANPLKILVNDCQNAFLVEVIKRNIENCSVSVPPDSQSELECLMFYDVSTHLCADVYPPDIDLKEHYTKKIANTEDVDKLCDNAKTWKVSNLENYPVQKRLLEKVFNEKRACLKLCSVEDFLNVDSNFYCKYFQWGLDVIKNQGLTAPHEILSVPTQNSLQNRTVTTLVKTDNATLSNSVVKKPIPELFSSEKSVDKELTNIEVSGQAPTNNQASESTSTSHKEVEVVEHKTAQHLPAPSIKTELEKPPAVAEEPPKKNNGDNMKSEVLKQREETKLVIDNSKVKQNVELDEEGESEFGNDQDPDDDPLSDQGPENGNDQIIESDPKLEVEKTKSAEKKIESITSLQDTVERESGIFPNPIQDSFADDDDHFFPFFLTAIILVVLLYILYHNKTKFTKVILGLIVEGRQTDRRRNSRGHSYRRLDTLEQAMSTNTAAPPSKIIY